MVSIDPQLQENRAVHPRITYVEGQAQQEATLRQVRELVGDAPNALVILGSQPGTHIRMREEFEAYHGFVPPGSYVIMENTVNNGHPVWPGFGPGPFEAVRQVLAEHGNFAVDPKMERFALTFNPSGFLKRMR